MISHNPTSRRMVIWCVALIAAAGLGCSGSDASTDDGTPNAKDDTKGGSDDGNADAGGGGGGQTPGGNGNGSGTPDGDAGGGTDTGHDAGSNVVPGDPLAGNGKDVVTLGDSYMRLPDGLQKPGTEGVELSLEKVSKRDYRNYGYVGAELFPTQKAVAVINGVIPGQFDKAKKENPDIKTVVIAAGGNDLTDDCNGAMDPAGVSAACKKLVDDIETACQKMVSDFANAGVKDVVWVGYGKTEKASGGFPPKERQLDGAIQLIREKRMANCKLDDPALAGLRCHYVDSRTLTFKLRDGFHPDAAGYDTVATAVWARMEADNVAR